MTKRTTTLTTITLLAMGALAAPAAQANYVAIFEEVGANVVEVGGGTIDLTDLTETPAVNTLEPSIAPSVSLFISGAAGAQGKLYRDLTGPRNFGPGDLISAMNRAAMASSFPSPGFPTRSRFRSITSPALRCRKPRLI